MATAGGLIDIPLDEGERMNSFLKPTTQEGSDTEMSSTFEPVSSESINQIISNVEHRIRECRRRADKGAEGVLFSGLFVETQRLIGSPIRSTLYHRAVLGLLSNCRLPCDVRFVDMVGQTIGRIGKCTWGQFEKMANLTPIQRGNNVALLRVVGHDFFMRISGPPYSSNLTPRWIFTDLSFPGDDVETIGNIGNHWYGNHRVDTNEN